MQYTDNVLLMMLEQEVAELKDMGAVRVSGTRQDFRDFEWPSSPPSKISS